MSDEDLIQRGADIRARRENLGITQEGMAEAIGYKDRGAIIDAEKGRESALRVMALVEQYLADYEESLAEDNGTAEEETVEFRIAGNFGVSVVVKGPATIRGELEESAMRFVKEMGQHELS